MSVDLPNQSLNISGGLPPLPTATSTTTAAAENVGGSTNWPGKKKNNNLKYILGGLLALILVGGTAFGAFYFTNRLAKTDVPTAPSSEPMAAPKKTINTDKEGCNQGCGADEYCSGGRCRKSGGVADERTQMEKAQSSTPIGSATLAPVTPIPVRDNTEKAAAAPVCSVTAPSAPRVELGASVGTASSSLAELFWTPGAGGVVRLWVSKHPDPTSNCLGANGDQSLCLVNQNNLPATTNSYRLSGLEPNTTYYWRIMTWKETGCDRSTDIMNFKTACAPTSWTPDPALTCVGTNVTQTSNCGTTRSTAGTKTVTWTPDVNTKCVNVSFVQTSNCSATRSALGTKTGGDCSCTATTWTPNPNTVCNDETLTQTSNCGTKRDVDGTKDCGVAGEPNISMEKLAFANETTNKAGDYDLNDQIDTVSKDETFVYAFEVTNSGDVAAQDIEVVDVLKGDNQELLTYVDGDDRCKYTSSSRQVTCSGMDLDVDDTDTYTFRVKVSSNAINGDSIVNVATLNYKDMPSDGEVEASLELGISTIVGCNHVCVSDDQCSTGLTCDPDTSMCRKPSCSEASTCNCPVERVATAVPTRRATVARVQPTELVEAGILDFPGVATFGGGLLLAVIGILLAL